MKRKRLIISLHLKWLFKKLTVKEIKETSLLDDLERFEKNYSRKSCEKPREEKILFETTKKSTITDRNQISRQTLPGFYLGHSV